MLAGRLEQKYPGKLKAPRIRTFALDRAGEAFELIRKGGVGGKLVVKI